MCKLVVLPSKFSMPSLADFPVYLAPAQVFLNVCLGRVCGRTFTCCSCGAGCSLGARWHLVQLPALQRAPWEGHFCMISSVVDYLRRA